MGIDYTDGYRARVHDAEMSESISIWVEVFNGGVPKAHAMVWASETRTDKDYGERARMLAFWEAVCRYHNSGGKLEELLEALKNFEIFNLPELAWDAHGFHLIETIQEVEESQHIFANDRGEAIVWSEGAFMEQTTIGEIARGQFEQAREDDDEASED